MIKVKATAAAEKFGKKIKELGHQPTAGETFEVESSERLSYLAGQNPWKVIFVESVKEITPKTKPVNPEKLEVEKEEMKAEIPVDPTPIEKPVKKTSAKKKTAAEKPVKVTE